MKLLGISSSSKVASASVIEDGYLLGEYTIMNDKTHSTKLMPIIESLLNNLELYPDDIDCFACHIGPRFFYRT